MGGKQRNVDTLTWDKYLCNSTSTSKATHISAESSNQFRWKARPRYHRPATIFTNRTKALKLIPQRPYRVR